MNTFIHNSFRMKTKSGFTLVEVLVACVLMAVVLAGFLGAFDMSKRTTVVSDSTMWATHEARRILETIRTYDYASSNLSVSTHNLSNGYYIVSNNTSYTKTKDIYLTIQWAEPGVRRTSSVSLVSSVTESMH